MRIIELTPPKQEAIPEDVLNQVEIDEKTGIPYKVFPFTKDGTLSLHASSEDTKKIQLKEHIDQVFKFDKD